MQSYKGKNVKVLSHLVSEGIKLLHMMFKRQIRSVERNLPLKLFPCADDSLRCFTSKTSFILWFIDHYLLKRIMLKEILLVDYVIGKTRKLLLTSRSHRDSMKPSKTFSFARWNKFAKWYIWTHFARFPLFLWSFFFFFKILFHFPIIQKVRKISLFVIHSKIISWLMAMTRFSFSSPLVLLHHSWIVNALLLNLFILPNRIVR